MTAAAPRTAPALVRDADALAIAAERATLGAMMLAADAAATVRGIVSACDFAQPRHAAAFAAAAAVADRGEPIAPLSIAAELERRGASADLGYLVDLAESTLTGAGAEHDARLVVEHANRRRIVAGARAALELANEGRDASALAEVLRPAVDGATRTTTAGTRQSLVESFDDLEQLPPPAWLVDGLLPAAGVALLVSPPNVGKSTLAVDLMMRCTTGQAWHGRPVQSGVALYCAGEGKRGLVARRAAWRSQHDAQAVHPHRLVTKLPPLSTSAGQAELEGLVAEHKPKLVVLDTVSALWGGASEDDASAVAPFLASLQRMAEAAGCLFLLIHHERKPSAQPQAGNAWAAVRGSGAWVGSADAVLSLSGPPEALQLATLKQRDGERLPPIPLRLVVVDLPNGGRSVVVVPGAEALPAAEDEPRAEDAILAAMRLLGADGITLPGAMQAGGCVKSTAWRALNLLVSNGLADQFGRRGSIRWRVR